MCKQMITVLICVNICVAYTLICIGKININMLCIYNIQCQETWKRCVKLKENTQFFYHRIFGGVFTYLIRGSKDIDCPCGADYKAYFISDIL